MSDLETMRHSTAHVMAHAVQRLFPEAKFGIGPPIEDGFYYDMELPRPIVPEDFPAIEAEMAKIVNEGKPFVRDVLSRDQALDLFLSKQQGYKIELINDFPPDETITTYTEGDFIDLCRGPHVPSTADIGVFKLLSTAGAYWRGDEHRPMLQRLYGTAWWTQEELDAYLRKLEEIERRDHRKLGRQLDLFSINETVGPGLILWHPKGAAMRRVVEDYWWECHRLGGYLPAYTPHIGRSKLWETSGHLGFFKENMYAPMDVDGQEYYAKPMNCPFHIAIFQSSVRSYRDLPMRIGELGTVYRYERSGTLHGLLRVRGLTQDDAHIFCDPNTIEEELQRTLRFCLDLLAPLGFTEFDTYLSTRPPGKSAGSDENWDRATEALRLAIKSVGLDYQVDEGGGAFYGPKIDMKIRDALGRSWQCSTIQFDFNMPERFDITYAAADGTLRRPHMIHRALLGAMERFFGVLIEHYAGAFPVWLAPVQATVLSIADRHIPYVQEVTAELFAAKLRVETDVRSERLNAKIREAQLQKVPYTLVVGDQEVENRTVSVRARGNQNLGVMPIAAFRDLLIQQRDSKVLE
jgi:threonyl-tRNA synthetase